MCRPLKEEHRCDDGEKRRRRDEGSQQRLFLVVRAPVHTNRKALASWGLRHELCSPLDDALSISESSLMDVVKKSHKQDRVLPSL